MRKQNQQDRIIKITIELDQKAHAGLGEIARVEGRSRRKQAARVVKEYVESHRDRRVAQPITA